MTYPIGIDTIINDKKRNFWGGFSPNNADGQTRGYISLKQALAGSRNIPAVKMTEAIGASKVQGFLRSIGMRDLSFEQSYGLAIGLGVWEIPMLQLAQSYMELSDQADVPMVHGIQSITRPNGEVVFDHQLRYQRTIPLGVAKLITHIISTVSYAPAFFREMVSVPGCPTCASKTGTTNMKYKWKNVARDAWLVTYNPRTLITIRAGKADASPLGAKAYGYTINTDIRNAIIASLKQSNYLPDDMSRSYPSTQTIVRKWQGESYKNPEKSFVPKSLK